MTTRTIRNEHDANLALQAAVLRIPRSARQNGPTWTEPARQRARFAVRVIRPTMLQRIGRHVCWTLGTFWG